MKGGKVIALLDTNVIVRFLISEENDKYKGLYEFFGSLIAHDVDVVAGKDLIFSVTLPVGSAERIPSWR